jgi:hypothetical protein
MLALLAHAVVLILGDQAQLNGVAPGTLRERGLNTTVVAVIGDR